MPLKPYSEDHPYGDTYVTERGMQCDGICNEECYEQDCYLASKCKECDTIFCLDENRLCPGGCDKEDEDE